MFDFCLKTVDSSYFKIMVCDISNSYQSLVIWEAVAHMAHQENNYMLLTSSLNAMKRSGKEVWLM